MKAFGDILFDNVENNLPGWSFAMPAEPLY
jgi:hypothetical protein